MKILFVDDESKKLKRLYSAISQIEGINQGDLESALDLKSAKEKLVNTFYDLVVLDLKISEYIADHEEESEIAGLEFIDEIIGTDSIKTPQEIVILTEHEELQKKCIELGKDLEFQVLKYDEQSVEWENIIKGKVQYRLNYEKSQRYFSDRIPCDVAIVCAVDVEMDAVKKAFKGERIDRRSFVHDASDYYFMELSGQDRTIKVVIAQQREMGMAAATNLAQSIIYHFEPCYMFMVDIAAGIGDGKNLGDIIAATEVWNYSNGKYIADEEGKLAFSPDPKHIILQPNIESILKRDYSGVLYDIRKNWNGDVPTDLQLVLGPLACGAAVVGNSEIVDDMIKQHSRKTVGLDMESYGIFYATNYGLDNRTIPICLKSISDFADEKKGDGYQKYAAYTSAEFAKFLIKTVLVYA